MNKPMMNKIFKPHQEVHMELHGGRFKNGIVKGLDPNDDEIVWVVFDCCNNDWKHYYQYMSKPVRFDDLKDGWIMEVKIPLIPFFTI